MAGQLQKFNMNTDLGNQPSGFPPTFAQKKLLNKQFRTFSPDLEGAVAGHASIGTIAHQANSNYIAMFKTPTTIVSFDLGDSGPAGGSVNFGRCSNLDSVDLRVTGNIAWDSINLQGCNAVGTLYFGHPTSDLATGYVSRLNLEGCSLMDSISGRGVDLSSATVDFAGLSALRYVTLRGTKLTAPQVDDIIITLNEIGIDTGFLLLNSTGNHNSSPTPAATGALYQLTGEKGWIYTAP